jgi:hypothetical protein
MQTAFVENDALQCGSRRRRRLNRARLPPTLL